MFMLKMLCWNLVQRKLDLTDRESLDYNYKYNVKQFKAILD